MIGNVARTFTTSVVANIIAPVIAIPTVGPQRFAWVASPALQTHLFQIIQKGVIAQYIVLYSGHHQRADIVKGQHVALD